MAKKGKSKKAPRATEGFVTMPRKVLVALCEADKAQRRRDFYDTLVPSMCPNGRDIMLWDMEMEMPAR
jgi:hypothetical protein